MRKLLIIVSTLVLLTGCATRGEKFEMSDVNTMQPGVTTLSDAKEKLGKPRGTKFDENGNKIVTWMWVQASMVGRDARGVRIMFDKDDKMVRVTGKMED